MNHIIVCAVVSGLYFGVFVSVVFLSDISKKKKVLGLLIALRKNKQINKCSFIYMAQIRTTAASMHIIL